MSLLRYPRPFAAALALCAVLSTAGAMPAAAAPEPDPRRTTDRLLFATDLPGFLAVRDSADRPELAWESDGCTYAPDRPFGYRVLEACYRHDFGYRNYRLQERFTEATRRRIDQLFLADMNLICGRDLLCRGTAQVYYRAVRRFGGQVAGA